MYSQLCHLLCEPSPQHLSPVGQEAAQHSPTRKQGESTDRVFLVAVSASIFLFSFSLLHLLLLIFLLSLISSHSFVYSFSCLCALCILSHQHVAQRWLGAVLLSAGNVAATPGIQVPPDRRREQERQRNREKCTSQWIERATAYQAFFFVVVILFFSLFLFCYCLEGGIVPDSCSHFLAWLSLLFPFLFALF